MNQQVVPVRVSNVGLMVYATLSTTLVAALFLSHWPTYNHLVWGGQSMAWFYLIPCLLIVPVLFAEPNLSVRFLKEPLFWWYVVYLMSGVLWLLLSQDFIEEAGNRWRPRLAAFGLFYSVTILSSEAKRRLVGLVVLACVFFACATVWFDVLRPQRFVPRGHEFMTATSGRGAGYFINPNVAAAFIAAATIAALPFVPMRFRGFVIVCAVVGILPTFSRSGYVYGALLLIGPILLNLVNRTQTLLVLVAVPLAAMAATASYDFLMSASDDKNLHNVVRRLEWFQGLRDEDEAVEGRLYGAQQAWQMFLSAPLTGRGLGITNIETVVREGPHNMYLMLMAEQGFLGMVLYVGLVAIFWRRGRRLAQAAASQEAYDIGKAMQLFGAMLFVWGFFDHNVLEQPFAMFLIGFVAAAGLAAPRAAPVYTSTPVVSDFRRGHAARNVTPKMGQP